MDPSDQLTSSPFVKEEREEGMVIQLPKLSPHAGYLGSPNVLKV